MKPRNTVSAIVPAYNEADRIGEVLSVLARVPEFTDIIVVDDSQDNTIETIARRYGAQYMRGPGQGKGEALEQAIQHTATDVLFFADADIRGLTPAMVQKLLRPVCQQQALMTVGVRGRRIPQVTARLARLLPRLTLIGGERALRRQLWEHLPMYYKSGFRIETGLNYLAASQGNLSWVPLPEVSQTVKEEKLGMLSGISRRFKMWFEVATALWYAQFDSRLSRTRE